MTDQPIFIVGVPRSGTSMIAGLLHRMGVWAGETVGPSEANPKGFFENTVLREGINKVLLSSALCDPLGVRSLPEWEDSLFMPNIRDTVLHAIREQGYQGGPWLFKDCKTALLYPVWQRAFPEAKWLMVRRKPADTIRSCIQTSFMAQHSLDPKFWGDWHNEYIQKLADIACLEDNMAIWPQKITEGDTSELVAVAEWLGLEYVPPGDFIEQSAWKGTQKGDEPLLTSVNHNVRRTPLHDQIRACMDRDLPELVRQPATDRPVALVAGGPSLKDTLPRLKRFKKSGGYVVALNGTHDWLIKHKLIPDAMVLMDARADNVDFLQNPRDDVTYYVASQCHPDVFDRLEGRNVLVWHVGTSGAEKVLVERGSQSDVIMGGCTVGMRAIPLMIYAGFREFNLFGMDSCYREDRHHAYAQARNDGDPVMSLRCGEREFKCAVWMARQAQDFQMMCKLMGDHVALNPGPAPKKFRELCRAHNVVLLMIHGGGLLSAMAEENRRIYDEERKTAA